VVFVPEADLARVHDAHYRFLRAVERLTEDDMRVPSRLPGWTAAHVLTHVARNADSHVRRGKAAMVGEVVDQYEGGYAGRASAIEAGSRRPAAEIVHDVSSSATLLDEVWRTLPAGAWTCRSRDVNGRDRPLFELPSRRWQEVEVHLVDLNVGVSHRAWPPEFILEWLPRTRERMWSQLPTEGRNLAWDHPADELAWLYGRLGRADVPAPPEWG
jgi:maleylpyruvate isomerase